MMKYENQAEAYERFLIEEAYNQQQLYTYIQEAMLWTSNDMTNEKLLSLTEDLKDTVKTKFNTLWEKIKEIVRKIVGNIEKLFSSNQSFLEKNKDIIIGKKLKYIESIDMYPYTEGVKRFTSTKIAEFNYDAVKRIDPENYNTSVVHGYFKLNGIECNAMEDMDDKCVDYFRGGQEKTFAANQINMTDLYNFCVNYNNIKETLDKDRNTIEGSYNKMINALTKVNINDNNGNNNGGEQQEGTPQNASTELYGSVFTEYAYSQFFDRYIMLEDTPNNGQPQNNNNPQPQNNNNNAGERSTSMTTNKPNTNPNQQAKDNAMDKSKTNLPKDDQLKNDAGNSENFNKIENQCKCWFNTASYILQAKAKVAEEVYKKYFEIISKHVKSYMGQAKDDTTGNSAVKNGTDLNNNLTPEAKNNLQKQQNAGITNVQIKYNDNNADGKNANAYTIQITSEKDGQNNVIYQSASAYPAANGKQYVPNSIRTYKDSSGIWKISRQYNDNGVVSKPQFYYIDTGKATTAETDYKDSNNINRENKNK